jgi:hypothetical protein
LLIRPESSLDGLGTVTARVANQRPSVRKALPSLIRGISGPYCFATRVIATYWVSLWWEPTSQHGLVSLFVVQGTATPHGKRALLSAEISTIISEDLHDQQMREKGECCTPHRKQISTTANRTLGASAAPVTTVRASRGSPHLERPSSVQPY